MKRYFISDTHFGHKNILEFENRPFTDVDEMDKFMIRRWNDKVSKDDEIYILGDFSFYSKGKTKDILNQLNGKKFLIRGNHDSKIPEEYFEWVKDYHVLKIEKQLIVLCHYPIQVWNHQNHGSLHFYGHVHSNKGTHHPLFVDVKNSYNVGADLHDYRPIEFNHILELINFDQYGGI